MDRKYKKTKLDECEDAKDLDLKYSLTRTIGLPRGNDYKVVLETLYQAREITSDINIKIGATCIKAHSIIICQWIPYFSKCLGLPGKGVLSSSSPSSPIEIFIQEEDVDGKALELVIASVYAIETQINLMDVGQLLKAAKFLGIKKLVATCENILLRSINTQNVFQFKTQAREIDCSEMNQLVSTFISSKLDAIINCPSFEEVPIEQLLDLFNRETPTDTFDFHGEMKVYTAIKKWIEHDVRKRKVYLIQLLHLLKLECFDQQQLLDSLLGDELVQSKQEAVKYLVEVLKTKIPTGSTSTPTGSTSIPTGSTSIPTGSTSIPLLQNAAYIPSTSSTIDHEKSGPPPMPTLKPIREPKLNQPTPIYIREEIVCTSD